MSLLVSPLDFARLSARLSLSDLPDFLVIVLRGDLSDMAETHLLGNLNGPQTTNATPYAPRSC
jgi:hypothetical protein